MKLTISNKNIAIASLIAVFGIVANLFGITGIRTLAAVLIFFFLPFYLILRRFQLDGDEKIFFAFFMGIGLFSTIVFYVGRVIPSFRLATAIAFIGLLLAPFLVPILLKRFKK